MLTKTKTETLLLFIRYQETIRVITDKTIVYTLYKSVLRDAYLSRSLCDYIKEFALKEGYDLTKPYYNEKTNKETQL